MPAGQMRKLTPRPLLRQHLQQEVDRVRGRQQNQKMDSPQLRRAEAALTSARAGVRPLCGEKLVGNELRELLQERGGSGRRQRGFHDPEATLKFRLRPLSKGRRVFCA